MRSSLLLLISVLSKTILDAHSYVAAVPAITSRRSWNFNLAAKDTDSSALEEDNSNVSTEPVASWDWEELASSAFASDDRPIILFDGKCNLCNGGVNFAIDHDPKGM
jgi:hypothetical protein